MGQYLLSTGEEREGFQPVPYWLDLKVAELPLTRLTEDKIEGPTTLGDVR